MVDAEAEAMMARTDEETDVIEPTDQDVQALVVLMADLRDELGPQLASLREMLDRTQMEPQTEALNRVYDLVLLSRKQVWRRWVAGAVAWVVVLGGLGLGTVWGVRHGVRADLQQAVKQACPGVPQTTPVPPKGQRK